jgi:hypothetical protein
MKARGNMKPEGASADSRLSPRTATPAAPSSTPDQARMLRLKVGS